MTVLSAYQIIGISVGACVALVAIIAVWDMIFGTGRAVPQAQKEDKSLNEQLQRLSDLFSFTYRPTKPEVQLIRDLDGSMKEDLNTAPTTQAFHAQFKFEQDYLTLICHPKIASSVIEKSIKSLGRELHLLKKNGQPLIPSPYLHVEFAAKGMYRLYYVTKEEMAVRERLAQAGLTSNQNGETVYPEFEIDSESKDIFLSIRQITFSKEDVIKALPYFDTIDSNVRYKEENVKFEDSEYILKATIKSKMLINPGSALLEVYETYKAKMDTFKSNTWVFGQNVEDGQLLTAPALEKAIIYVVGGMGSGKTVLCKSLVYSRLINSPDLEVLYFDGKSSMDWIEFAERTSVKALAKPRPDIVNNQMVEFSDMLEYQWQEFLRRQQILQGSRSSNYIEHNQKVPDDQKIKPILCVWEEAPVLFSFIDFNGDSDVINSDSWKMKRLGREMRSYGMTWIMIAQTATRDSVPTLFAKQATFIIGKSDTSTAERFKCDDITTLDREFIIFDQGKQTRIKALYLGNDSQVTQLIEKAGYTSQREKIPCDYERVSYKGTEDTKVELHQLARASFFKDYEKILWNINAEVEDLSAIVKNAHGDRIAIYYIEKDELVASHLNRIASSEVDYHLFVLTWELNEQAIEKLEGRKAAEFPTGSIFLSMTRFKKLLARAFDKEDEDVFDLAVLEIEKKDLAQQESDEERSKELDKTIGKASSATTDWDYEKVVPEMQTTLQELDRIASLKGGTAKQNAKKGMLLEAVLCKYFEERSSEDSTKNVYAASKLKASGIITTEEQYGDGGVDIVLEHTDGSYSLIQVKNYADHNLVGVDVVDKTSIARQYLEHRGLKLNKLAVYTTGRFSGDAEAKAKIFGVDLLDGNKLEALFRKHMAFKQDVGIVKRPGRPKKDKVPA